VKLFLVIMGFAIVYAATVIDSILPGLVFALFGAVALRSAFGILFDTNKEPVRE
jgi:hypothetical protein